VLLLLRVVAVVLLGIAIAVLLLGRAVLLLRVVVAAVGGRRSVSFCTRAHHHEGSCFLCCLFSEGGNRGKEAANPTPASPNQAREGGGKA